MEVEQVFQAPERSSPLGQPRFSTPAQFLLLLTLYFALHVLVRYLLSRGVELDEAEQVILTQRWSWGYGAQPPLYTWIQSAAFAVFGLSVFALSLVKNALLLGTFIFACLSARIMFKRHLPAAAAAAGLLLFPQIAWESQRDLTHTVLALFLAAVALYVFLRLWEHYRPSTDPSPSPNTLGERRGEGPSSTAVAFWYIALGASLALGLLSKYNFALFAAALLIAGVTLPSFRPAILNRRLALSAIVFTLLMLPHALWLCTNRAAILSRADLDIDLEQSWLHAAAEGLGELGVSLLGLLALLVGVFAIGCWKPPRGPAIRLDDHPDHLRLIVRKSLIILISVIVAVLALRITEFKERWFLPMVVVLPAAAIMLCRHRLDEARLRGLFTLCAGIGVAVLIALASTRIVGGWIDYPTRLGAPFPAIAKSLEPALEPVDVIIADTRWIGGNLRMFYPDKTVLVPELWRVPTPDTGRCLIIWDLRRHPTPPPGLLTFARTYAEIPDEPTFHLIEAPYWFYSDRTMQLGFFVSNLNSTEANPPAR